MPDLLVRHHLGQGEHRREGHVFRLQPRHPVGARPARGGILERRFQREVVLDPGGAGREAFVVAQAGTFQGRLDPLPELLRRRQVNRQQLAVAAAQRIGLRRHDPRQRMLRDAVLHHVRPGIEHEGHGGFQHVHVDATRPAAAFALEQRAENAVAGVDSGHVVGDRGAGDLRVVGVEKHAGDAGQRLGHRIVGGPVAIRAVLAEAGDRAVDQLRVGRGQRLRRETQPLHHAGAEILDQHVGGRRQLQQDAPARPGPQIEGEAPLVAVEGAEMRAIGPASPAAEHVAAVGLLDLDDLGPEIGEHLPAQRPGDHRRELDDADAIQHRHAPAPALRPGPAAIPGRRSPRR